MEKNLIKTTGYASAIAVLAFNMQSCKKYEDGPGFSLRTKKARLVGDYEVVRIGNQSYPQGGYSIEMEFEKDGDFSFTYSYGTYSYSYAGDWEFSSDKEDLEIKFGSFIEVFEIKRLTNKEVWLEDTSNDEWRLEAK